MNLKDKKTLSVNRSEESRVNNNSDQTRLEEAVIHYQTVLDSGSTRDINAAYQNVCSLYQPLAYIHVWYRKYHHFYDSKEDFVQVYLFKFLNCLQSWKPKHLRAPSLYDGKGTFANYFWGALDKMYSNRIKEILGTAKRNIGCLCPICNVWCNVIGTHLRDAHTDLLFEQIEIMGLKLQDYTTCPLCKSHKAPRRTDCIHVDKKMPSCTDCLANTNLIALKKHLIDKHSSLLFERFQERFPDHITLSSRPMSVNTGEDDEGNSHSLYDTIADSNKIDNLLNANLSPVQKQIVETIILSRALAVEFKEDLYKCTPEEFQEALDDLRTKMVLFGWDGSDEENE